MSFLERKAHGAVRRLRTLAERRLERHYGVSTGDYLYLEDLGLSTDDRIWHHASDWLGLRAALRRLSPGRDDVFVDYGSGLGRAVLVAAGFPFRRVMGVELSTEMTDLARANVERNKHRFRAAAVDLVAADATEWEVPADLTVAYLYSPFTGRVFDAVFENLCASVDAHPRPLRILYNYPVEHSRLIRTGRARVLDVRSSQWLSRDRRGPKAIVTYLVLPRDQSLRARYEEMFPQRLGDAEQWLGEYEPGFKLTKPERLGGVSLERPVGR